MTIASQTSKVSYAGSDAYTSPKTFTVPFYFVKDADVAVVRRSANGAETPFILTTHYTLSGAGDLQGGSCTLATAPATGETVVIYRDPAIVQETDYQENDAFPAQTHEAALDLLTMIDQAQEEKLGRAVKAAISSGLNDLELPAASPGAALVWNTTGDGLANAAIGGIPGQVVAVEASASAAAAAQAKAALWAQETENIPVEPGKYSAYHWARQARAIAEDGLDAFRTPAPQLSGAATQTEYLDVAVAIANFDADAAYTVEVTGGSFARDGGTIAWTLPGVDADTPHLLAVFATRPGELRSETTEHWVTVKNLNIVADDTVIFGADTVSADWPLVSNAAAYSDTEVQGAEEEDWGIAQVAVDLSLAELTVDESSTVSSLIVAEEVTEGDTLLVNDDTAGTALTAIQVGTVSGGSGETLDNYSDDVNSFLLVGNGTYVHGGQSITPASSGQIASIELYLYKYGSPTGTVSAKIFATSGGLPTGSALATSADVNVADLETSATAVPFEFSSPVSVTASTQYAIVLDGSSVSGNASNYVRLGTNNTLHAYAGGTALEYTTAWATASNHDVLFAVYSPGQYTCAISPALDDVPDTVFRLGAAEPALLLARGEADTVGEFVVVGTDSYTDQEDGTVRMTSESVTDYDGFRAVAMGVTGRNSNPITAGRINLWKEGA